MPLLAAALTADGIPYHEPYRVFLRAARDGVRLYNPLDNHFSPAGHRLFARVFTDSVVRAETLDRYAEHRTVVMHRRPGRRWPVSG